MARLETVPPPAPLPTPTSDPPRFLFGSLVTSVHPQATPTAARHYPPPWEGLPAPVIFPKPKQFTREALLRQLEAAKVVSLAKAGTAEATAEALRRRIASSSLGTTDDPTLELIAGRSDLVGLPWRRGKACRLSSSQADHLDRYSSALRGHTAKTDDLKHLFWGPTRKTGVWSRAAAVPTLMQMLTPEDESVRQTLVSQLWQIEGQEASEGLARIALFDPEPEIRKQAVGDLTKRPSAEYLPVLLSGFSHPWPPVADHAAEAIVALKARDALPTLVSLLDAPDPRAAYAKPGEIGFFYKEMVRIEHTKNCLLCHPPSFGPTEQPRTKVPGSVPRRYYPDGTGTFVRADVSYLKQDYSVSLTTESDSNESETKATKARFDFFVRESVVSRGDLDAIRERIRHEPNPQRNAVLFALTHLAGRDLGGKASVWKVLLALEGSAREKPSTR